MKILLSALAVFMLTCAFVQAQVEVSVSTVNAAPASRVLVPIIVSEGRGISAVQLALTFDSQLLSVSSDQSVLPGTSITDHSLGVARGTGKLTVLISSASLSNFRGGAGTMVNVIFQVSSNAAMGTNSKIQISGAMAVDGDGNAVGITPKEGAVIVSNESSTPIAGANEQLFPQIANGSFQGGSFTTTLIFVNNTGVATSGEVRFFQSDGTPMPVRMTNGQSGTAVSFSLGEGGSIFLQTDGSGPLATGYARLLATGPVGGTILFSQRDANDQIVTESGVGASRPLSHFSVPLIYAKGSADTGIAFANASLQSIEIVLTLRDRSGAAITTQPTTLAPGKHLPRFATEYFSDLLSRADFLGSIEGMAPLPLSAIALKLQGKLLTTFPVVEVQ